MYNHNLIEKKWHKYWKDNQTFKFKDQQGPKFYVLDMFPYPSGKGLHVGHPKGYTATDVISRYKRLSGYNVLHPIGWDAFGLPAEQYAIETQNHPQTFTYNNINIFRLQLERLGFDYDISKEVNTTDPKYYKWTQWIFAQLFAHGLAEIKDIDVNWCETLKTTLSNEEIIMNQNGVLVSERGGYPVIKKPMRQWVLKITQYADKLLDGLDKLQWPESLKNLQRNWIGKMQGYELDFLIDQHQEHLTIFTTRIDTIYGVSYLAINPKHPLINKLLKDNKEITQFVENYNKQSSRNLLINKQTHQINTNLFAIHPLTKKRLPILISDYVIENIGTGAIIGVPAHNKNDFDFAKKYNLEIIPVLNGFNNITAFEDDGIHINSEQLNGLDIKDATKSIIDILKQHKCNVIAKTTYKLRDWVFSRQRYWGEPFPIIFDQNNNPILVNDLPVLLPECKNFKSGDNGKSPLANIKEFIEIEINNQKYYRDSNTMPQWAGSCWYYLGYILKQEDGSYLDLNSQQAYDLFKRWLPVDIYIGGQEHAVLHLLYARFWHLFLYDIKIVPTKEPFQKIINQGMILGPNGEKMSKSKGNVISPDEIITSYGADALRLYELFMGPLTATLPWTDEGINGMRKWLDRVYRFFSDEIKLKNLNENFDNDILNFEYHNFIKNISLNLESLQFNLAISDMMIFMNTLYKQEKINKIYLDNFLIVLSCFAPHLSEELWSNMHNQNSVCLQTWPTYNEKYLHQDTSNIPFQINGKLKLVFNLSKNLSKEQIFHFIEANDKIKQLLDNKEIIKKIYIKDKIVNYLVKEN